MVDEVEEKSCSFEAGEELLGDFSHLLLIFCFPLTNAVRKDPGKF